MLTYWFQRCRCSVSSNISCLVKHNSILLLFLKCITLCICLCFSSSSCFCASLIQYVSEFKAKKYFIDHQMANTIQLFVPIKKEFFWSHFFQNNSQRREIPQALLCKYSHGLHIIQIDIKGTLMQIWKTPYMFMFI